MSYLALAADLVGRLEGCKLVGYADSGGVPTNGWGHTGPEVRIGQAITQEIADHNRTVDLSVANDKLEGVVYPSSLARLADHQRAALISFVYNVGANPEWTIWKDLDSGNLADVPTQLRRFDKGMVDGKLTNIYGLDNRREAEIAFWNAADVDAAAALARPEGPGSGVDLSPPSHTTVSMETPPTPVPAPPLARASLIAKATTIIGGVAEAAVQQAHQVQGVITPYLSNAKIFATINTIATGAIVAGGIVGVLIHGYQANARSN